MNVNAVFVEKTSKAGKSYQCIEIELAPGYKKMVFLTQAELALYLMNNN